MVKKFEQYNESLRDKMLPKSKEEIEQAKKDLLIKIKNISENPEEHSESLSYYLQGIYTDRKKLINDLIDEGLDPNDLLIMITDDFDLKDLSDREKIYKLKVMGWMYNLIEKNIDDLDTSVEL